MTDKMENKGRKSRGSGKPAKGRTSYIKFYSTFTNTIYDVLCSRGWKEVDSETEVRIRLNIT